MAVDIEAKVEAYINGSWADLTPDIMADKGLHIKYGNHAFSPANRAAGPGLAEFALDNGATNSGGAAGYYSPGHPSVRTGWKNRVPIRVTLRNVGDGVHYGERRYGTFRYGGDSYKKWQGKVVSLPIAEGKWGGRTVDVRAEDYMADSIHIQPTGLTVQSNAAADDLLTAALAAVDNQPPDTSFEAGVSTFETAFDEIRDRKTSLNAIFRKATASEQGDLYLIGSRDQAGLLTFYNRDHHGANIPTPVITLDETTIGQSWGQLAIVDDQRNVYNIIRSQIARRALGASDEVLWALQGDALTIAAGGTLEITGHYRDPNNPDVQLGAMDVISPTTDDITFNQTYALTVEIGGNATKFTIVNTSGSSGSLSKLQIRGTPIRTYDPVDVESTDSDSVATFDEQLLSLGLDYQNSPNEAQDLLDAIAAFYADGGVTAQTVTFQANLSAELMTAALETEPGQIVYLADSQGPIADSFFIQGVELQLQHNVLTCTWALSEADTSTIYFRLDISALADDPPNASDDDAVLGF